MTQDYRSKPIPRHLLANFLPDERSIRAYEALLWDVNKAIPENLSETDTKAIQALQDAAAAQATADQAVIDAAAAQSTADQAVLDAATAQADATQALTETATLQSDVSTLQADVSTAQTTADQAITDAAAAQADADDAQARVGYFEVRLTSFGSGSPEGVVTALVGKFYVDTAAAQGQRLWIKQTGAGNTGWLQL